MGPPILFPRPSKGLYGPVAIRNRRSLDDSEPVAAVAGRQAAQHLARGEVDLGDHVAPGLGGIEARAVARGTPLNGLVLRANRLSFAEMSRSRLASNPVPTRPA